MHVQASFAKWNEGQKDRPKQVNAALEAHKARIAAADAAAQQQKEAVTVRPVPKGKKEQPLELHPDQFVRIKAHKTAGNTSTSAATLADLAEVTASPAVDVEVSTQLLQSLPQHSFSVGHTAQCSSNSCVFRLHDYHIAILLLDLQQSPMHMAGSQHHTCSTSFCPPAGLETDKSSQQSGIGGNKPDSAG